MTHNYKITENTKLQNYKTDIKELLRIKKVGSISLELTLELYAFAKFTKYITKTVDGDVDKISIKRQNFNNFPEKFLYVNAFLSNICVRYINLSDNSINFENSQNINNMLDNISDNRYITKINLSQNLFIDTTFLEYFIKCCLNIDTLILKSCRLGGRIVDILDNIKQFAPNIKNLNLKYNDLNIEFSEKIFELVSNNENLKDLKISFNEYVEQYKDIFRNFIHATCLESFSMHVVTSDFGYITPLMQGLEYNHTLKVLDLSYSSITSRCIKTIANVLCKNNVLEVLRIDHIQNSYNFDITDYFDIFDTISDYNYSIRVFSMIYSFSISSLFTTPDSIAKIEGILEIKPNIEIYLVPKLMMHTTDIFRRLDFLLSPEGIQYRLKNRYMKSAKKNEI